MEESGDAATGMQVDRAMQASVERKEARVHGCTQLCRRPAKKRKAAKAKPRASDPWSAPNGLFTPAGVGK